LGLTPTSNILALMPKSDITGRSIYSIVFVFDESATVMREAAPFCYTTVLCWL